MTIPKEEEIQDCAVRRKIMAAFFGMRSQILVNFLPCGITWNSDCSTET